MGSGKAVLLNFFEFFFGQGVEFFEVKGIGNGVPTNWIEGRKSFKGGYVRKGVVFLEVKYGGSVIRCA